MIVGVGSGIYIDGNIAGVVTVGVACTVITTVLVFALPEP